METIANITTTEDAIAYLKRYITFKRQANAADAHAKELAPIAIQIVESGMVDALKVEGYTATFQLFTDSAIDNCVQYQSASAPGETVNTEACVKILEELGIPVPMKATKGRAASLKATSLKGTAEKKRKQQ